MMEKRHLGSLLPSLNSLWMRLAYSVISTLRFIHKRSGSSDRDHETHLEVSTASVDLIELAPDSHSKTTQIAPNGKRVAP